MVGGLIKQQQIGAAHQGLRQIQAHAPAAGKGFYRLHVLFLRKAQPVEQLGCPRGCGVGIDFFQPGMVFGDFHALVGGFGFGQGRLKGLQLPIALQHIIERGNIQRRRFLRHRGQAPMFGQLHFAAIGADFAFYQGKQAGFAGAVFADQAHALIRVDGEAGFVEQHFQAALQGEVFDFYHGCGGVQKAGKGVILPDLPVMFAKRRHIFSDGLSFFNLPYFFCLRRPTQIKNGTPEKGAPLV